MSRGVASEMILHMNFPHPLLFRKSGTAARTVHKKCYGVRRTCRSVSAAYAAAYLDPNNPDKFIIYLFELLRALLFFQSWVLFTLWAS